MKLIRKNRKIKYPGYYLTVGYLSFGVGIAMLLPSSCCGFFPNGLYHFLNSTFLVIAGAAFIARFQNYKKRE